MPLTVVAGTLVAGGVAVLTLPVPPLDASLAGQIRAQVGAALFCPGAPAPQVETGGTLLPQMLAGRLDRLTVTVPDVALLAGRPAPLTVTLRGVTDLRAAAPRAASLDTQVTLAYPDLPRPALDPAASFTAAPDGRLRIDLTAPKELTAAVPAVVRLGLSLRQGSIVATPEQVTVLGSEVPLDGVRDLVGEPQVVPLPATPSGLRYTGVEARPDGVHVTLEGSVTTPLSALPGTVDGRQVGYRARNGQLGISTTQSVFGFDVPVTIWTTPTVDGGRLVLTPQTVDALGSSRPADDPLVATALDAVDPSAFSRPLPALPAGVAYRSAAITASGVTVAIGGDVVQPLSTLPLPQGLAKATVGADNGRLTVTTSGLPAGLSPKISLVAEPRVDGTTLRLTPVSVTLLGQQFDAATVFTALGGAPDLSSPLPALGAGLTYSGATATPDGLRVDVHGSDLVLNRDLLPSASC